MSTEATLMTDEELMQLPDDGYKYEYIDGELEMSPAGMRHERIGVKLLRKLDEFVEKLGLGGVYGSNTGYRMKSGNVLSPDVSFVRKSRLPEGKSPEGFGHFAPDLAVEILSPSDSLNKVEKKVAEYFENGSELVWVMNPKKRITNVYISMASIKVLQENEDLTGEKALPGFSCRLDLLE